MKFYDFTGSSYSAVIYANNEAAAIKKYKKEISDDEKIICKLIDIDKLRMKIFKEQKKLLENGGMEKETLDLQIKEELYKTISKPIPQVFLIDKDLI